MAVTRIGCLDEGPPGQRRRQNTAFAMADVVQASMKARPVGVTT
jgi:hypothetical protein